MLERPDPPIVPRVYRPRGDTPVARKSLISSELRAADASRVAAVAENSIFWANYEILAAYLMENQHFACGKANSLTWGVLSR